MNTENPVTQKLLELEAEGLRPASVSIERTGPSAWVAVISIASFIPLGEGDGSCGPGHTFAVVGPMPEGVALRGWERYPNQLVELAGSDEQMESVIRAVASRFGAVDCARFDAPHPSYPHFLAKIPSLPPTHPKK